MRRDGINHLKMTKAPNHGIFGAIFRRLPRILSYDHSHRLWLGAGVTSRQTQELDDYKTTRWRVCPPTELHVLFSPTYTHTYIHTPGWNIPPQHPLRFCWHMFQAQMILIIPCSERPQFLLYSNIYCRPTHRTWSTGTTHWCSSVTSASRLPPARHNKIRLRMWSFSSMNVRCSYNWLPLVVNQR